MAFLALFSLFIGATGAFVIYTFCVLIYRLIWHPLAKYPGPFLARISQWPEALSAAKGRRHIDLHLLHEKYGDIVRISPHSLSFRTARAFQDIYTDRRANVIKTGWTDAGLEINPTANTHNISNRKLHAARRRLLSQAFSETAMKSVEKYVIQCIEQWCNAISQPSDEKSEWSKPHDIGHWSTLLTLDVLGELSFGSGFGAIKKGESYIVELLIAAALVQNFAAFFPFRKLLFPILRRPALTAALAPTIGNRRVKFRQTLLSLVSERFALEKAMSEKPLENQRKDFFHYLLNARDPETGDKFEAKDLTGEAALLLGAGSDTSSTALSGLFFYLTRNPRVLAKLQREVRAAFNNIEEIKTGHKLNSLTYLRACIDEAMRMSPPVPTLLSRVILPGGAVIDGTSYPDGIVVGVPIYSIHHNEKYFRNNFEYIPERWIPGSSDAPFEVTSESIELAKSAFVPFSTGPRGCVGKNMAYMELLIVVARVMWLFEMRLKEGDCTGEGGEGRFVGLGRERKGEYQLIDYLISDREGPVVELKKRKIV